MEQLKIFICAHKPIENKIPDGDNYVIIAQNDSIKDKTHKVMYLTDDKFTKDHWRCYGEGCAIRYLWKHPELVPEYIGINHYRRFFLDFIEKEETIIPTLEKYKAIIPAPFKFDNKRLQNNFEAQTKDHFKDDSYTLREVIKDLYPNFSKVYEESLFNDYFTPCNIFIMRKKDFLEMCEICFTILEEFDKRMNYFNNDYVYRKILHNYRRKKSFIGVEWQARLQGFYLEWLTDAYYKYKFGINNCYISEFGIPGLNIDTYGKNKNVSVCSQTN